jgi:hypothetical protein
MSDPRGNGSPEMPPRHAPMSLTARARLRANMAKLSREAEFQRKVIATREALADDTPPSEPTS